jgi:ABC-type multidrug transport system ATPase subunit
MKKEGRIIVIMTTHDARQAELLADTLIQIKSKIISL